MQAIIKHKYFKIFYQLSTQLYKKSMFVIALQRVVCRNKSDKAMLSGQYSSNRPKETNKMETFISPQKLPALEVLSIYSLKMCLNLSKKKKRKKKRPS